MALRKTIKPNKTDFFKNGKGVALYLLQRQNCVSEQISASPAFCLNTCVGVVVVLTTKFCEGLRSHDIGGGEVEKRIVFPIGGVHKS